MAQCDGVQETRPCSLAAAVKGPIHYIVVTRTSVLHTANSFVSLMLPRFVRIVISDQTPRSCCAWLRLFAVAAELTHGAHMQISLAVLKSALVPSHTVPME